MKRVFVILMLISLVSCTMNDGNDQFRTAQGYAMQGQMAAHQQASLRMLGGRRLAPLVPMQSFVNPQ